MADLLLVYRTYCRVVERASISRAALDLDMAQASVSRHLQELEQRYAAQLIARTTRSLRVTPAGQKLYDYAKSVLQSEAELAERLVDSGNAMKGRITVAGPMSLGYSVLNPFAISFGKRYPDIKLRLFLSDRQVNLVEEGVDVAIRIGPSADSTLIAKPLGTLEEVLVGSPKLFPTSWRPTTTQDLMPLARVALSPIHRTSIRLQSSAGLEIIDSAPVYEVDNSMALQAALIAGLGYGAIHHYMVKEQLRDGGLIQLLPDRSLPSWPINAMFVARGRQYRVDHFVEELVGYLRKMAVS